MSAVPSTVLRAVPFDFPGFRKPRLLRYNINSMCELEATLKMSPREIFMERTGMLTIRGLLWVGLKWEDRMLTETRVGGMMNDYLSNHGGTLEALMAPISEAIKLSGMFPEREEGEAEAEAAPEDPDSIDVTGEEGNGRPPV